MPNISEVFLDGDENVKIELYCKKAKKSNGMQVVTSLNDIKDDKKADYTKITFFLRPMTWGLYNRLQHDSTVDAGTPSERIDWTLYKEKKIMMALAEWDLTDKEGKPIPVMPETIFKLHPFVVESLINAYDAYNFLGDADTKK